VGLPLPRPALYDAWLWARLPPPQWRTGPVDVVHATTVIVPPTGRAPLVVTVHDLAFLHEPAHFTARGVRAFRRGLELIRRHAAVVLCSSSATLADAAAAGIPNERLRLVLLGVDQGRADPEAVASARERHGLAAPYLLFVGTLEPRKNLVRLVDAWRRLPPTHVLAIAGPVGWGRETTALFDGLGERVRLLGFVPDPDRAALYAGADALCYPSLREGFGLPVAEAMVQGTPVVTSAGTSTEEVAGGAAVLVDPLDPASIAAGIEAALADRDRLAAAGRARAATLTWDATAIGVLTPLAREAVSHRLRHPGSATA
jgi:glycosyltransferase involved in cell wall biosynthesis